MEDQHTIAVRSGQAVLEDPMVSHSCLCCLVCLDL